MSHTLHRNDPVLVYGADGKPFVARMAVTHRPIGRAKTDFVPVIRAGSDRLALVPVSAIRRGAA
jgi:hypothetical protein